ncbi:selenide, water dikinase SelD [Flavihumibacter stibioxidans]|uniref:Selenide, water dikinase n=1 Tax=Flavihumibacter stibioxidans TaxID=1834163 RepID=A0ABR7MCH6_9BACT|nr:selenide, water dikinase SelD [Flavihumibacter stibioxidans]MBC6492748.1 selenide,water dikinase SelD [Flavihumibacter stibioxidans]
MSDNKYPLTQYSHGAGCGCKISPQALEQILHSEQPAIANEKLLVGNQSKDDAAVYDLGNDNALISTTDFFMPIVDDAYDFGRIASANAISDVYAMGGRPILAIAILGWPIEKLPAGLASQVLEGARATCALAGIPLAGGHSIDSPEPLFGLAVNGLVHKSQLKQNNTARRGDLLLMTKSLGTGVLSTAQKRSVLEPAHYDGLLKQLVQLNNVGEKLAAIEGVHAMTDITGFGLLGHLIEMAEGSGLGAQIQYEKIPVLDGVREYLSRRIVPDATYRNWNSYSNKVGFEKGVNVMEAFSLLPDPQTNGGLLIAVDPGALAKVQEILRESELENFIEPIGEITEPGDKIIMVK